MLRPISAVLDRLAQRCLALGASMLATTFETLQIAHHAEQQSQLEELARSYEAEGLNEIATSLREKAKLLTLDRPAAGGEALLTDLAGTDHKAQSTDATALRPASLIGEAATRRLNGRQKRGRSPALGDQRTEGSAPGSEVFFPLNAQPPAASDEGQAG